MDSVDVSGRALSEGANTSNVDFEINYRKCPYHDSRLATGKPLNGSALDAVSRSWDRMHAWVAFALQSSFVGRTDSGAQTYGEAWLAAAALRILPFLFTEKNVALGLFRPIAVEVASAYKASRGVTDAIMYYATHGGDVLAQFRSSEFFTFVDSKSILQGPSEVCAAPRSMIERFCQILTKKADVGEIQSCQTFVQAVEAMYFHLAPVYVRQMLRAEILTFLYLVCAFRSGLPSSPTGQYPMLSFAKSVSRRKNVYESKFFSGICSLYGAFVDGVDSVMNLPEVVCLLSETCENDSLEGGDLSWLVIRDKLLRELAASENILRECSSLPLISIDAFTLQFCKIFNKAI